MGRKNAEKEKESHLKKVAARGAEDIKQAKAEKAKARKALRRKLIAAVKKYGKGKKGSTSAKHLAALMAGFEKEDNKEKADEKAAAHKEAAAEKKLRHKESAKFKAQGAKAAAEKKLAKAQKKQVKVAETVEKTK